MQFALTQTHDMPAIKYDLSKPSAVPSKCSAPRLHSLQGAADQAAADVAPDVASSKHSLSSVFMAAGAQQQGAAKPPAATGPHASAPCATGQPQLGGLCAAQTPEIQRQGGLLGSNGGGMGSNVSLLASTPSSAQPMPSAFPSAAANRRASTPVADAGLLRPSTDTASPLSMPHLDCSGSACPTQACTAGAACCGAQEVAKLPQDAINSTETRHSLPARARGAADNDVMTPLRACAPVLADAVPASTIADTPGTVLPANAAALADGVSNTVTGTAVDEPSRNGAAVPAAQAAQDGLHAPAPVPAASTGESAKLHATAAQAVTANAAAGHPAVSSGPGESETANHFVAARSSEEWRIVDAGAAPAWVPPVAAVGSVPVASCAPAATVLHHAASAPAAATAPAAHGSTVGHVLQAAWQTQRAEQAEHVRISAPAQCAAVHNGHSVAGCDVQKQGAAAQLASAQAPMCSGPSSAQHSFRSSQQQGSWPGQPGASSQIPSTQRCHLEPSPSGPAQRLCQPAGMHASAPCHTSVCSRHPRQQGTQHAPQRASAPAHTQQLACAPAQHCNRALGQHGAPQQAAQASTASGRQQAGCQAQSAGLDSPEALSAVGRVLPIERLRHGEATQLASLLQWGRVPEHRQLSQQRDKHRHITLEVRTLSTILHEMKRNNCHTVNMMVGPTVTCH